MTRILPRDLGALVADLFNKAGWTYSDKIREPYTPDVHDLEHTVQYLYRDLAEHPDRVAIASGRFEVRRCEDEDEPAAVQVSLILCNDVPLTLPGEQS